VYLLLRVPVLVPDWHEIERVAFNNVGAVTMSYPARAIPFSSNFEVIGFPIFPADPPYEVEWILEMNPVQLQHVSAPGILVLSQAIRKRAREGPA
jgi:hypothetical protein